MEPLGEIGSVEPLDVTIQLEMNVPPAMLVQFKMYDSRRDVRLVSCPPFLWLLQYSDP